MSSISRNMKNQVGKAQQNFLVKFGIFLSLTAALSIGMPTPMKPQEGDCEPECNTICNVKCHDSENKSSANCSDRRIDFVPPTCNLVEELILDNNRIQKIDEETFETFDNLAYLRMRNNSIYEIDQSSFANTKLRDIDLSENDLATLGKSIFQNLSNLTQLNLKKNKLSQIDDYDLPNLTSLTLSDNRIEQLRHSNFERMQSLKILDLSHNSIEELENGFLGTLRNLTTLTLSHNEIQSIDRYAFEYLARLQELHLDNNLISMAHPDIFQNQEQLRVLNISSNKLTSLKAQMLEKMKNTLEQFSASDNEIAFIEGRTFIGCEKLTDIDLTNNKLPVDMIQAIQTLINRKSTTRKVKILLAGNPICDKYVNKLKDSYNVTVFCSENQTLAYAAKEVPNTGAPAVRVPSQDKHQTLKTISFVVAAVVLVMLLPSIVIWRRYKWRGSTSNLRQIVSNNMGYNYPHGTLNQVPDDDAPPPPVPARRPSILPPAEDHEGPYINGTVGSGSSASYIQPTASSNYNSRGRGMCQHHRTPRRSSRSSNRPRPEISAKSPEMSKSITVIGTNTGGSCRQMHVTGLPMIKKQWRQSMSRHLPGWYTPRCETGDGRPKEKGAEGNENTYMVRHETEDGRPINPTLETNQSATDTTDKT